MALRDRNRLLVEIVAVAALLLAAATVVLGWIAGSALRQRDRAVREGVLLVLAADLQGELRAIGPGDAASHLRAFVRAHAAEVAGAELTVDGALIARAGIARPYAVEVPMALGPAWRDELLRRQPEHRGPLAHPPFQLRLFPAPALGTRGGLANAVVVGSVVAAVALFTFAMLAVAGLAERTRRLEIEHAQRRLEIVALTGSGLAHRIRNPLATIKGTAQFLRNGSGDPDRLQRIIDASERIETMIHRMLDFARPPKAHAEPFDLAALANELAQSDGRSRVIAERPVFVHADREHVESAIEELIANARAFDAAGTLEIAVDLRGRFGEIEVRDRGPGLKMTAEQAMQPYVTSRADGTGLGLPTAEALIRATGGEIRLRNRDGGGCIATVAVPIAEAA